MIFTIADNRLKSDKRTRAIIEYTIPHMSEALLRLIRIENKLDSPKFELSNREIEVLKWTKEGKTSYEISVILKISERTVTFHISNIKQKLDVSNKTHAVAVALKAGIISL